MTGNKRLTKLQRAYCESAARGRSPTEAAKEAGYKNPARAAAALEKKPEVQAKILRLKEAEAKQTPEEEPEVADQTEILEFLTQAMREEKEPRIRMKAAELLGKRARLFQEPEETEGRVVIVDDVK